jgi:DNA-binding PadR family transcriptional regulator
MTVRMVLLGLVAEQPGHGYDLRGRFLERTGGTWPLNIGQVYTTLGRLVRDGLVVEEGTSDETRVYAITDAGTAELEHWFATPVPRDEAPRDELAMKVVLALGTADFHKVLQVQRREVITAARTITKEVRAASSIAERLLLESRLAQVEAEGRWLDHTESIAKEAR